MVEPSNKHPSKHAKILGETDFRTREIPRSGSKAKDGKEEEKTPKVCNNNGQQRIATPPRVAHAKPPGPIFIYFGPGGLRAPCVAWPLLFLSFGLFLSFFFSPSFAFDPLRGISRVRKFVFPIFWHNKKIYAKKNILFR